MSQGIQQIDLLCADYGFRLAKNAQNTVIKEKEAAAKKTEIKDVSEKEQAQQVAKREKEAAKEAERVITHMLSIMQHQGIYAAFLWLPVRGGKASDSLSKDLVALLNELLKEMHSDYTLPIEPISAILEKLRLPDGLLSNLSAMLLAKSALEQALIYARYHAKVAGGE